MTRSAKDVVQRLGAVGLTRALDDVLDQSHLVKLANTCGLKYPGMRTQTRSRERLLSDLVDRAGKREDARLAILRMLTKETAEAGKEWAGLETEEKVRRLCDEAFLRTNGNLGLHLFLLAASDGAELDGWGDRLAHFHLVAIASNGAGKAPTQGSPREEARLRRRLQDRDRKILHLDGQLSKSREAHKTTKSDLIQRKGELAESRMLVERLRRELTEAQAAAQVASAGESAGPDKAVNALTKTVRKLAAEQKTLAHRLETLTRKPAGQEADGVLQALKQIRTDLATQASERNNEQESIAKRIEALRAELRSRPSAPSKSKAARRGRKSGTSDRVGVFIDVQNVYYAARKLKGKLDFDALLQAAVQDRRLIKATAYVVESKETDQTQFINRLQQKAIEVRRKTLQVRSDGSMKGDWDMELALDILDGAPKLDVVVLVSGDGDFTSLVKRVKDMGPRVEVIAFPRNAAKSLLQAADSFQPLDRKFMIYTRSKPDGAPAKPRRRSAPAKSSGSDKRQRGESTNSIVPSPPTRK